MKVIDRTEEEQAGVLSLEEAEEIVDLLSEVGRTFKANLRSLPNSPAAALSMPQRDVLKIIGRRPGVTPAGICERTRRDRGQVTRLTLELEEAGLILRTRSTEDRRSVLLTLSDRGTELFAQMLVRRADLARTMLSGLTVSEVQELKEKLRRMRGVMRGFAGRPRAS
ncbi:MarR family winged helix-turn-helix transcriptional regulator [Aureimonas mangrovi]|uniref:MarR family winged helix-turn-helix transcriptional regulator n=1 Tax=Aureimonas mangrovi TaxID=2758041 RepID=UPI00163DA73C|nr:MarR family transcriptional regulator [Aureimonas mangrovi]